MNLRKRRLLGLYPKLGDIFLLAPTGTSPGFGFSEGNPDDNGGPDGPTVEGIQTQDGQNIEDQGGDIIQAQGQ